MSKSKFTMVAEISINSDSKLLEVVKPQYPSFIIQFFEKLRLYDNTSKRPFGRLMWLAAIVFISAFVFEIVTILINGSVDIENIIFITYQLALIAYVGISEFEWRKIKRIKRNRIQNYKVIEGISKDFDIDAHTPVQVDANASLLLSLAEAVTVIGGVKSTSSDLKGEPQWFIAFWNECITDLEGPEEQVKYAVDRLYEACSLVRRYGALARITSRVKTKIWHQSRGGNGCDCCAYQSDNNTEDVVEKTTLEC